MKKAGVIFILLAIVFMCGCGITDESAPSLPSAFKADVTVNYTSELSFEMRYSGDSMALIFSSPESFAVTISGGSCTLAAGSSVNTVKEESLPEKGFLRLFPSALTGCLSSESPTKEKLFYVYSCETAGGVAKLYVNKDTLCPERLEIADVDFSASFQGCEPIEITSQQGG